MPSPRIGIGLAPGFWELTHRQRQAAVDRLNASGLDHVCVTDHVAFRGGNGWDGFTQAAALAGHGVQVPIHLGVALLPLRHPALVARQLLDVSLMSAAGVVCGVGVGGEDPDEYATVGLDHRERGARMDEALPLLRRLLDGEPATHDGRFYRSHSPGLQSRHDRRVGLMVGGTADAAIARGALVDGWVGTFAKRDLWAQRARALRALNPHAVVAHQLWAGAAADAERARALVDDTLVRFYGLPPAWFGKHTPAGDAATIADFLRPWTVADAHGPAADQLTVFAVGESPETAIDIVAEARRALIG
jgi:alkanesulfonate monooxygenase SsuD/methylene tetrahydromethanopterin reductase-like flavin-dependent oxidoreductase (luciferase family)